MTLAQSLLSILGVLAQRSIPGARAGPCMCAHVCSLDRDAVAWTRLQRGGQGRGDVRTVVGAGRGALEARAGFGSMAVLPWCLQGDGTAENN